MVSDSSDGIDWRNGIAIKLGVAIALVIAVIAIGWGWHYGLVQERTYEQEARQAHADQSENGCYQIAKTQVQSTSVKKLYTKPCTPDEKAKQENDNRRDYADLVAQRSSALWAKIMGIAALIGMGLSLVGVALVWTTFRETRKSNEIAAATTEADNRAWIKVATRLTRVHVWNEAIQIPNLEIKIENVGASVARHIRCWASLHIKPSGEAFQIKFDDIPEPQFAASDLMLNLWQGEPKDITRPANGIGPQEEKYYGRDFEIYLRIVVKYYTVFHPKRDRTTELIIRLIDSRGGPFNQGHIPQNGAMIYNVNERLDGSGGGQIT